LLLIAEVGTNGEFVPLKEVETIVRLGEGVDASGCIQPQAVQRAIATLDRYLDLARTYGATAIRCCGTSALRDARNRDQVVREISEAVGLEVEILTGKREAELTYLGALSNKPDLSGRNLMIDIGGGSTEFVIGSGKTIEDLHSVDVGSVRLTERYLKHDPVSENEFREAQRAAEEALSPLLEKIVHARPDAVLGVAGTVTTLKAMELRLSRYDPSQVDGQPLRTEAVAEWVERLRRLPVAERARLPGLRPERADVILAGAIILCEALRLLGESGVIVSDRGLRYGMLLEVLRCETKDG
jgi:exopolyphosphatase/guanosine-5'-triphosphate,3'-diphosphate pyrophosphatase